MSRPLVQGHRARLRARFDKGIAALHEYEILELLLTYVLPRRDTKSLAKDLLRRFKTITGVLQADPEQLRTIGGMGNAAIRFLALVRETHAFCMRETFHTKPIIACRKDIETYLRVHFGLRRKEYVVALFLDNGNRVLHAEVLCEGTTSQCVLYPRFYAERALAQQAASVILAHNHPGGSLHPSDADWAVTRRLHSIGRLLEIPLLDHIIVTDTGTVSLREMPQWPHNHG